MNLLIVSATYREIEPFLQYFNLVETKQKGYFTASFGRSKRMNVLITGVGMVPTAASLSALLALRYFDLAVNAGICGSFQKDLNPGEVVQVTTDFFPELGAETEQGFLPAGAINLLDDSLALNKGILNQKPPLGYTTPENLREVAGATVNTVHGNTESIRRFLQRFSPDIETMEGAAFFYACLKQQVPCIQYRAVSNYVESRNPAAWNIPLAIASLNEFLIRWVNQTILSV